MITNAHYIELYINKELIELESQESLNMRINNVLFDPTKTSTTQAEYSFSFEIPSTPNNDRILNYANNLSKVNKFHARYPSQVYADGDLIFDGSLTIQKYSARDRQYTCNLVNIKVNTLDEIFGESVLTDINNWNVEFSGSPTINSVNEDEESKYYFPLVSYGVFQKNYVVKDEVGATYTPKHTIDKYNKWWIDSFYPSLNVAETVKKAFEWKGYNVGGSMFSDPNIANVYASCNLANEQVPTYNLGNPKFGHCHLKVDWNNYNGDSSTGIFGRPNSFRSNIGGIIQDLKFPYNEVRPAVNAFNSTASEQYNFSAVDIFNVLDSTNNPSGVTVQVMQETYMYDPGEQVIVIPADGWYKIKLKAQATLSGAGTTFEAEQWTNTFYEGDEFKKRNVNIKRGFSEHTPLEIQLIRNYEDNVELIKGRKNITYDTGDPNQTEYRYRGGSYESTVLWPNKTWWTTDFPHQDLLGSKCPTKPNELTVTTVTGNLKGADNSDRGGGWVNGSETQGGTFGGNRNRRTEDNENGSTANSIGMATANSFGYVHRDRFVMPYDQAVSTSFICGFSTLSDGTVSVMRNGSSWSKMSSVNNKIFADVRGLDLIKKITGTTTAETETVATEYCANEYKNSSSYIYSTDNSITDAQVECCVYLNRNDILELVAIQRDFDGQKYATSAHCEIEITAFSERSYEELKSDKYFNAYSDTEFPKLLNLFNFTNKEKKVSEWIDDVQKAFNLEIIQEGNNIDINTNKGYRKNINNAIDIDDRVSNDDAIAEYISYPKEMSVKYKIDTSEWGFELTVPQEHINDEGDEWKKWGDSGFTIIQLNDDTYETSTQNIQTNFSYTYYDNFLWKECTSYGVENENFSGNTISIPVIEKAEYMAEGYGYEEAMKHDGFSFTQRFWYRQPLTTDYIWTADHMHEKIYLTYPINVQERFNLSYKDTEKSIVTEYFNIAPMLASNYVKVEVYLNPDEYKQIKGGALIHYDSDLYYVCEISGYDCSGNNPTELKLLKKI